MDKLVKVNVDTRELEETLNRVNAEKKIADQAVEAENQLSKGLKTNNQVRQEFGLTEVKDHNFDLHLVKE